jgi:multidrug efflux pump subunit AcrA (membrane-fusion protein)
MRRKRQVVFAAVGLLIITSLIYTLLWSSPRSTSLAASPPLQAERPTSVRIMVVQQGSISQQLLATGDILAAARVEVFPKVEGHLRELRVEEGDRVQAGQMIAQIANDDLKAEVARAEAQVDALRAEWAEMQAGARPEEIAQAVDRVEQSRAELENTEWMLRRIRAMVERGMQSAQELEEVTRKITQARAAHNIAQTQLQLLRAGARSEEREALQARLRAAQSALHLARVELQHATVTVPMDGVVGRRHVDPGAYITTTNTPIVTIVAMDTLKIRMPVSERDIGSIRPELHAQIRVDAYGEDVFTGKVQRVSPLIDPTSRSGEVEISIANPDHRLKPGMFAKVALILEQRQEVVVIPRDALRLDAQGAAVFVVQDGVAHLRRVATGLQTDTEVEILDALAPGTEIVLAGHHGLKDQAPVQIVQARSRG